MQSPFILPPLLRTWFSSKAASVTLVLFILLSSGGHTLFKEELILYKSSTSNVAHDATEHDTRTVEIPSGLPVVGAEKISSYYGNRIDPFTHQAGFHAGIDFSAKPGTPILATATGKVKRTGLDWKGNGLFIEVEHGSGYSSHYAHLNRLNFVKGDLITKDQILGEVGSSGRSTGPHLHYEIVYRGSPINPVGFLSKKQNELQLASHHPRELKKILVIRNDGYYYKEIPVR